MSKGRRRQESSFDNALFFSGRFLYHIEQPERRGDGGGGILKAKQREAGTIGKTVSASLFELLYQMR